MPKKDHASQLISGTVPDMKSKSNTTLLAVEPLNETDDTDELEKPPREAKAQQWISTEDACSLLDVSYVTFSKLASKAKLLSRRKGHKRLYLLTDVQKLAANREKPGPKLLTVPESAPLEVEVMRRHYAGQNAVSIAIECGLPPSFITRVLADVEALLRQSAKVAPRTVEQPSGPKLLDPAQLAATHEAHPQGKCCKFHKDLYTKGLLK